MLSEKKSKTPKKTKKKHPSEKEEFEENLQSMKTWVRKIEQTSLSVSSRLAALERRISGRSKDAATSLLADDQRKDRPMKNLLVALKDSEKKQDLIQVTEVLDSEFSDIQDQLMEQDAELAGLKQQLQDSNTLIKELKEYLEHIESSHTTLATDVSSRVQQIERRAPPTMKIGTKEIPIEMTGVIGGLLMFVVALIVALGHNQVIGSPVFLAVIGFILLGSAIMKTIKFSMYQTPDVCQYSPPVNHSVKAFDEHDSDQKFL